MVTQTNSKFFQRFEALLNENLEKDLHSIMVKAVESEAKIQVYGQGALDAAIANKKLPKNQRLAFDSHTDIDEYHPHGHLNRITGTLGRSITTETEREGDILTSYVGTNIQYARIHELGGDVTQSRISKKGKSYTVNLHIPARPFLVPAYEIRKDEVKDYIAKRVKKMVEMSAK